jgi:Chaperone of endosialidase
MIVRFVVLAAVICFGNLAQAQTLLHTPASACTPDAATIRFNRELTANGSVRHAPTNVDRITLICPITPSDASNTNWTMLLTYRDTTGTNTAAFVRAQLFEMNRATGIATGLTSVTSNSSSETTLNTVSRDFNQSFDFFDNAYWVRIELDRAATNQTVIAYSVAVGFFAVSDIRLKHDIELLGHLDNGLGFYRFAYNGSDKAWVGVMAQEVQTVMPEAVVRGQDGYLRVSYGLLGFPMQPYEHWLAAGGKLPAGNSH